MNNRIKVCCAVLVIICNIHGNKHFSFYVSPGLGIGFGFAGLTLTAKISAGIHNYELEFINLTYGRAFNRSLPKNAFNNGYRFLEVEAGLNLNHSACIIGGGAGVAFVSVDKIKILPKLSLFGGSILFLRTDHIIYPKYKRSIINSYGGMVALPISPGFYKDVLTGL